MNSFSVATALVKTLLPTKQTDSDSADFAMRLNSNRELAIRETPSTYYGMAEEGSLFLATNPTISTGVTFVTAQTAHSDTAANFYIYNSEASGGKNIMPRYLKMIATAAGTSATVWHYAAILDSAQRAPTTNNTVAITPVNVNGSVSNAINATVLAQNNATTSVFPASSANKRVVARGAIGGLNIVGDTMIISFGQLFGQTSALTAAENATQSGTRVSSAPPVVIPPGSSLVISIWSPSSAAAFNPEFELLMAVK